MGRALGRLTGEASRIEHRALSLLGLRSKTSLNRYPGHSANPHHTTVPEYCSCRAIDWKHRRCGGTRARSEALAELRVTYLQKNRRSPRRPTER